jgi:uncharacterized glyoxalase superfamily protein PhnB
VKEEIYGMPSFPMLTVNDLEVSSLWYQEVLGFRDVFTFRMPDNRPVLAHLRWAKYADLLLVRPTTPLTGTKGVGVTLFFAMPEGEPFVDGLADRARQKGAIIVSGPADTPWNARDVTIADPDGFRLTFTGSQRGKDGQPYRGSGSFEEVVNRVQSGMR